MNTILHKFLTVVLCFGAFAISKAATITSASNGVWSSTSTWVGGIVPVAGDDVIINHRVDVDVATGAVTVQSVTISNSSANADLDIFSGTTFTVTDEVIVNLGNFSFNAELILRSASELIVTNNIKFNRLIANTNTQSIRFRVSQKSKVSCHDYLVDLQGTGGSNSSVLEMSNASVFSILGKLSASNASARDLTMNLDSSTVKVSETSTLNLNANGDDLILRLTGTSLFESDDTADFNQTGGDDMTILVREDAILGLKKGLVENHTGGDQYLMDVRDRAKLIVVGTMDIIQSSGNHYRDIRDVATAAFTGDINLNRSSGSGTYFRLHDKAVATVTGDYGNVVSGGTINKVELNDTSDLNISGNFVSSHSGGGNQEVELNEAATFDITGNYKGISTGTSAQIIDMNGGVLSIDGVNGLNVHSASTLVDGFIDLSVSWAKLDVTTGPLTILNSGTRNYSLINNGGEILVATEMSFTNTGRNLICNMYNTAKLEVKGGNLMFLQNPGSTGDLNLDFNSADVDVNGDVVVILNSPSADDATFDILGASNFDCKEILLSQLDGDQFTSNFRGTSVVNCDAIKSIANRTAFSSFFGQSADINISSDVLSVVNASATGSYTFRVQDNATMDILGPVTIDNNGGVSAIFGADDTCIVNVTGALHFDPDNNAGTTKLDLTNAAIVNLKSSLLFDQDFGTTNSCEIEANHSSKLTVTGNVEMRMNAGSELRVDLDNTAVFTINGPTGLTFTALNGTGSPSIDMQSGSKLDITAGGIVANQNTATVNSDFNFGVYASTLNVKKNLNWVVTQGDDARITFGAGSNIDIDGDLQFTDNGSRDDATVTFSGSTVDIAGDVILNRNSVGVTTTPDMTFNVTAGADFDLGKDLKVNHILGRDVYVNFSGNGTGGSTTDIAGSITATRSGATARNLIVTTTGNNTNGGVLNVSGDINMIDNGTNALGIVRVGSANNGNATTTNVKLTSTNAGNNVELETSGTSSFTVKNDVVITTQTDGDGQIDMNNTSHLYIGGSFVRNSDHGNLIMAQNAYIHFNGTSVQEIPSRDPGVAGGDLFNYTNIELNNPAGFTMGAGGAEITDTMIFANGILTTTAGNLMTFDDIRSWAMGASSASHISGPVRKFDGGAFVFPTGNAGELGQFSISDGGNNQDFTVEYFHTTPIDTGSRDVGINNVSSLEYWQVTKAAGGAITVAPHWDDAYKSGINDLNDLFVVHYTGGQWINEGNGGTTGGILHNAGTVISAGAIGTFSPITFGSASPLVNPLGGPGLMETVKNGNWHDPATWDANRVPTASDYPIIWHNVTVQSDSTGVARSLDILNDTANAELDIRSGATIDITTYLQAQSGAASNHIDIYLNDGSLKVGGNILITRTAANAHNRRARLRAINSSSITCNTLQVNAMGGGNSSSELSIESSSSVAVSGDLVMLSHMNADQRISLAMNGGSMKVIGKVRNSLAGANENDIVYSFNGTGSFSVGDSFIVNQQGGDDFSFSSNGVRTNTFSGPVQLDIAGGDDATISFNGTGTNTFKDDVNINHNGGDNMSVNFRGTTVNEVDAAFNATNGGGDDLTIYFRDNTVTNMDVDMVANHSGGRFFNIITDEFADVNVKNDIKVNKSGGNTFNMVVRDTSTLDLGGDIKVGNTAGAANAHVRTVQNGILTVGAGVEMTNSGGNIVELESNQTSEINIKGDLAFKVDGTGQSMRLDLNGTSKVNVQGSTGLTVDLLAGGATSQITGSNGSTLDIKNAAKIDHRGTQDFIWSNSRSIVKIGDDLSYAANGGDDASFYFGIGSKIEVGNDLIFNTTNLADDFNFTCDSSDVDVKNNLRLNNLVGGDVSRITFTGKSTIDITNDLAITKASGTGSTGLVVTGNSRGGAVLNVGADLNLIHTATSGDNLFMSISSQNANSANKGIVNVKEDVNAISFNTGFGTRVITSRNGELNADNMSLDYNATGSFVELELNNTSKVKLLGDLTMDATTSGDVFIDMNGTSNLCIAGNIVRPNDFGASQMSQGATITYNGSGPQILTAYDLGAGDLFRHTNVLLDNGSGFNTTEGTVYVSDTMIFRDGIVLTAPNSDIWFVGSRASADSATGSSHVDGPATKTGAGAFRFPTGQNGWLGMISISDPGNAGDFTARYFNNVVPIDTGDRVVTLTNISHLEYWDLDRNSGSSSAYVTLWWENSDSSFINNLGDLKVAHYDGNTWQDEGQSTASNYILLKGFITSAAPLTSFSPFTFGSGSLNANALPVEMMSFNATKISNKEALVEWKTAVEINNDYFEVERSIDGKHFNFVAQVDGQGNTSNITPYLYIDDQISGLNASKIYYRLKQVDFNGNVTYSDVRSIRMDDAQPKLVQSIYPNPAGSDVNLALNVGDELNGTVTVNVVNVAGKTVRSSQIVNATGNVSVNLDGLASGVYMMQVSLNGRTESYKLVKN